MKCETVACVWSDAPPLHRVVATAVLNQPPTLYTGGSDGSIIWWAPSSDQRELSPIAMLCGHASAIAGLDICVLPITVDGSSNVGHDCSSAGHGALISACTDGVLCVWSRGSGHCRRRRKMPPWVGNPSSISTLAASPRYVCIACSSIDSAHVLDHRDDTGEISEGGGGEGLVDRRAASKCAVVIVDSYSLNIIRTVFHGGLSIGPLKFMGLFSSAEDAELLTLFIGDAFGKVHTVSVAAKEFEQDGEGGISVHTSSEPVTSVWPDSFGDGSYVVSMQTQGKLLVLVYRKHCVFRLVGSGYVIGELSLVDSPLHDDSLPIQSHLAGGTFLCIDDGGASHAKDAQEGYVEHFAFWSNLGATVVYRITFSENTFRSEVLFEISSILYASDVKVSVNVCQLNGNLLRIESFSFIFEESLLWKPHITIWSLCQQTHTHDKVCKQSKLLGKGIFPVEWDHSSSSPFKTEASIYNMSKSTSNDNGMTSLQIHDGLYRKVDFNLKGKIVSSSMVLSESFCTPYAIVYGFYNGEIEVVQFEMLFREVDSADGSPHCMVEQRVKEQCFSGHAGPILCMAAHFMNKVSHQRDCSRLLVSGSMDCTIRIWDFDTGDNITVMHHHVAPVRQIILPPPWTNSPWNDCFLSVGEDSCVALVSLETFRVERMFSGHPNFPSFVVWDGARGYVACLCKNLLGKGDSVDFLYLWDVKTGARERILRGTASHSMFDHFCRRININPASGNILGGITSTSSLVLPVIEDASFTESHSKNLENGVTSVYPAQKRIPELTESVMSLAHSTNGKPRNNLHSLQILQKNRHAVKCSCPFPGITAMVFDLSSLMFFSQNFGQLVESDNERLNPQVRDQGPNSPNSHKTTSSSMSDGQAITNSIEDQEWLKSLEGYTIRFSLSFLHWWGVDQELDNLLMSELNVIRPEKYIVASGLLGDRGSLTLMLPASHPAHELWCLSSEFCAIRSLTMVSLAQRMISLSLSSSAACSALSAFYTRSFLEKVHGIKPPSLQLLSSFWQDESEHVRMAARSLFHCAASRAIPLPLCGKKANQNAQSAISADGSDEHKHKNDDGTTAITELGGSEVDELGIHSWLESFEIQDWVSCVGGTRQDAMSSHIIVAAALAVWYPSLVKPCLAILVVHALVKLVMAMNGRYSSTAAELLAEGMESTWKACFGPEISPLIRDVFFQIDCLSSASVRSSDQKKSVTASFRETLIDILLPSLAMADIPGFLHLIERQIWSTASDSPVHLVSLMTLIRVMRGSLKPLAQYIDKVVSFILQTMDPGNSVMRKACLPIAMAALKEIVRVYPMVSINDASTKLAVGDAIGDISSVTIRVYDMQSVTKIRVLDASGPPGLPGLLGGTSEVRITTAISALSFSPDGEGLVAFSERGLMIRWWSLGSAWWEKLSRSLVPVQCTKLIFVPPWEGFSSTTSRSSIIASITGPDREVNTEEKERSLGEEDNMKLLIYCLDLSYQLEWAGDRKIREVGYPDKSISHIEWNDVKHKLRLHSSYMKSKYNNNSTLNVLLSTPEMSRQYLMSSLFHKKGIISQARRILKENVENRRRHPSQ
ncbi:hypothetical protein Sjap_005886 [Stephania japonica]|uniref:Uncharacterized protein n=1 Tax=Stephania japonica TaxID=461633 RepID=A0AAP0K6F1_9MAGN